MRICFATNNTDKLREIRAKMPKGLEIISLQDIGCHEELPETGNTLQHNAHEKASFVSSNYGIDCFADDTGLEVSALGGAPGVYSARYAGPACDASANIEKLLTELKDKDDRSACFRTVICLMENGQPLYFEGTVSGIITEGVHGVSGFGYDPVFKPLGFDSTFAQMSMEQKNVISHRGKAVEKLLNYLEKKLK